MDGDGCRKSNDWFKDGRDKIKGIDLSIFFQSRKSIRSKIGTKANKEISNSESGFVLATLKLIYVLSQNNFVKSTQMMITLVDGGLIEFVGVVLKSLENCGQICIVILHKICSISIQYGESQNIQLTKEKYESQTLIKYDAEIVIRKRDSTFTCSSRTVRFCDDNPYKVIA